MIRKPTQLAALITEEIADTKYGQKPDELYEPIRYIMSLGGKRLRPLLTTLSYSLFRDDVEAILQQAVAVEVFHNFTLMHDDIMDQAPLRRGNDTVHEKWNPNTAILSGDVMLVKAYHLLLTDDDQLSVKILKAFNECAARVCEGQQLDMLFEQRDTVSEDEYIEMIRLKTAVLLGYSLELGGLLARTDAANCQALREFGINIGIGFQLKDDLLDVYADQAKFGKQQGGDILANKKTFLLIKALEKAEGKQKQDLESWLKKKQYNAEEKIAAVTEIYDQLGIRTLTGEKMNYYFEKAFRSLRKVDAAMPRKAMLRQFTERLTDREV